MTRKELQEALDAFPEDAEVVIFTGHHVGGGPMYSKADEVIWHNEAARQLELN